MKRTELSRPLKRITLAFVPTFLFLIFSPIVVHGDELKSMVSPREMAHISGKAKMTPRLPMTPVSKVKKEVRLTVTAYSSTKDQCDADPFTTASGTKVADGIIAMNGVPFGTKVRFPDAFGDKVFVVQDRMNARYGSSIADVWMPSRQAAVQWGKRYVRMQILES